MSDDEKHVNRRRFFREGLRELLKPISKAVDPIHEVVRHFNELEREIAAPLPPTTKRSALPAPTTWLRPPGALEGGNFTDVCSRCGECVKVCPAECIKIDASGNVGSGAPYIEPDVM